MNRSNGVVGPQVPHPHGPVQGAGDESSVLGRHVEPDHLLAVALEVPNVLVVVEAQVPQRVVHLGRRVDGRGLGPRGKLDEVHAVLLGKDDVLLLASVAVVDDNLVVVAARDEALGVGRKVNVVDVVLKLAEDLGLAQAPDRVVVELHAKLFAAVVTRAGCVVAVDAVVPRAVLF